MPGPSQSSPAFRLRVAGVCFVLASLAACANWPANDDTPADAGELLKNSLPVAAAALAAGQLGVARRLYLSLSERFDDAPEPFLGLGYIALQSGDSAFIRMLVAAGRIDDAARTYARHPPAYWPDDDALALSRLVEEARRQRRIRTPASARTAVSDFGTTDESPAPRVTAPEPGGRVAPALEPPGSGPARPEEPETSIPTPPRDPDPDLAMRLYLSDALPAQTSADARAGAAGTPPDRSVLLFDLDGWPGLPAPPAAADDTAPGDGGIGGSEAARAPSTAAPAPSPAASAPSPAAPAPAGPARPHPLPDPGMPAPASFDPSLPATVNLVLGQSRRIHLEHDATSVLVAAPEVADVRLLAPNVLYVIGKGIGRTSVAVLHDDERIEERIVAVALDLEPLRTILAGESDLRGVRARRLSRGVALTGEVDSAASVDRALRLAAGALPEGVPIENELQIAAPQQVNLEVQIAEVHRSVTEDLGVNWEAFRIVDDNQAFGFRVGRVIGGFPQIPSPVLSPPFRDAAGHVSPSVAAGFAPTLIDGQLSPSAWFGKATGATRIGAMIDALATAGLANVLARPNVTAVSGESASFFSGGERPIPTGYDAREGTILFEYKKVGVLLDFVPTVVDTGRIVLTVRPEVSEPDASQPLVIGPVLLPVINVRRAETTVEVADGESIVIAGLFSNRSSTTESGLPGLKDVPLLGLLFGTTSIRSNELELIVIVTARLVRPNAAPGETTEPAATLQAKGYHY